MDLDEIKREYVRIYGKTAPCSLMLRCFPADAKNYLGIKKEKAKVILYFRELDMYLSDLIEMHFRNRLSRKFSYASSQIEGYWSIDFNDYESLERVEVLLALIDLVNYLRGRPMTLRLKAELSLYDKGCDWRDKRLVYQEMKKLKN